VGPGRFNKCLMSQLSASTSKSNLRSRWRLNQEMTEVVFPSFFLPCDHGWTTCARISPLAGTSRHILRSSSAQLLLRRDARLLTFIPLLPNGFLGLHPSLPSTPSFFASMPSSTQEHSCVSPLLSLTSESYCEDARGDALTERCASFRMEAGRTQHDDVCDRAYRVGIPSP
jgi:hypothetical protein